MADFDIKHNFTSTMNWELPFGKGKKFGGSAGPVADKLIRGWQLNMILLARSGLPFTVTQQQGLLSNGTGNRPNRLVSGVLGNPTVDRWWDISAFKQPPTIPEPTAVQAATSCANPVRSM